jgi:hypothetical protein
MLAGQPLARFAQAGRCGQRHEPFGRRPVVADRCHCEDEPALAEADGLDQDRAAGAGQDDHVARVDVTGKNDILHG